jgi:hypothetical protein
MIYATNYWNWWIYLTYLSMIHAQCTGNGLNSCSCNFIGSCIWNAKKNVFAPFTGGNLQKFVPKVKSFAASTKVAEICEPGDIGVLYDCANRIPLASTAVLSSSKEYLSSHLVRSNHFRQNVFIGKIFQQHDTDYEVSLNCAPML